ncbi:MAG: hypothetical protein JWQ35_1820, partial [Bacteriovoracaceae bacterium]|nr:hypothetical protein [Bacteriovoracaceae bacterium]
FYEGTCMQKTVSAFLIFTFIFSNSLGLYAEVNPASSSIIEGINQKLQPSSKNQICQVNTSSKSIAVNSSILDKTFNRASGVLDPNEALFIIGYKEYLRTSGNYESLILTDLLVRNASTLKSQNQNFLLSSDNGEALSSLVNKTADALDTRQRVAQSSLNFTSEHPLGMLKEYMGVLKALPAIGSYAGTLDAVGDAMQKAETRFNREGAQRWAQIQRTSDILEVQDLADDILSRAWVLAKSDTEFGKVFSETILSRNGNISPLMTQGQFFIANPKLAEDPQFQKILKAIEEKSKTGKTSLSTEDIQKIATDIHKRILDDLVLNDLERQDATQKRDILKKINDDQQEKEAQQQINQMKLENANYAGNLMYLFLKQDDPKSANDFRMIFGAAMQIAAAYVTYSAVTATASATAASAASLQLYITVALAIATLVVMLTSDSGDDRLGQELNSLHDQIQKLGQRMEERFDQVDRELKIIFHTMLEQFKNLHQSIAELTLRAADIQRELGLVHAHLFFIEDRLAESDRKLQLQLSNLYGADYQKSLLACLSILKRDRPDEKISHDTYLQCRAVFLDYARNLSENSVNLESAVFDSHVLLTQMKDHSGVFNINYILKAAQERAATTIHADSLPNILEWNKGTQAYLELQTLWPEYSKSETVAEVDDLRKIGEHFQVTLKDFVTSENAETFWNHLFDGYASELEKVYEEALTYLDSEEKRLKAPPVNIWTPTASWRDKETQRLFSEIIVHPCPNQEGAPRNLPDFTLDKLPQSVLPLQLQIAAHLNMTALNACYAMRWVEVKEMPSQYSNGSVEQLPSGIYVDRDVTIDVKGRHQLEIIISGKENESESSKQLSSVKFTDPVRQIETIHYSERLHNGGSHKTPRSGTIPDPYSDIGSNWKHYLEEEKLEYDAKRNEIDKISQTSTGLGSTSASTSVATVEPSRAFEPSVQDVSNKLLELQKVVIGSVNSTLNSTLVNRESNRESTLSLGITESRASKSLLQNLYTILFPRAMIENFQLRVLLTDTSQGLGDGNSLVRKMIESYEKNENYKNKTFMEWTSQDDPRKALKKALDENLDQLKLLRELTIKEIRSNKQNYRQVQPIVSDGLLNLDLYQITHF